MADEKFDLVFRGELVPGADLAQVKQNLSRLFKMAPERIEVLFSGKPVVLKRGMDADAAGQYRVAIKKAGARIDTVASRVAPVASANPEPAKKPSGSVSADAPVAPPAAQAGAAQAGLSLAPVGGNLLAPGEVASPTPVAVDTSSLSLRPAQGALLDASEREEPVPLPLDLSGLAVAPPGTEVLRPEERKTSVAVEVDLSGLSLAPAGERLPQLPRHDAVPVPDTSGLSIQNEV